MRLEKRHETCRQTEREGEGRALMEGKEGEKKKDRRNGKGILM